MTHLCDLQDWLRGSDLAGLMIPSTDESLSEFALPANRRLRWVTGFRGSTGLAVVLLDGRYGLHAAADTEGTAILIESPTLESLREWLKRSLRPRARLGLDPGLHSMPDVAQWKSLASDLGFELDVLDGNPIDTLWAQPARPAEHLPPIVDCPIAFSGETYQAKCERVTEHIEATGLQALLVADPEDVSWLLNLRAASDAYRTQMGDWHIVPSCISRALVRRAGEVIWFVDEKRLTNEVVTRGRGVVTITSSDMLAPALREVARQGPIGVDINRTPAALVALIEAEGNVCADDTVARRRWCKAPAELQFARRARDVAGVQTEEESLPTELIAAHRAASTELS